MKKNMSKKILAAIFAVSLALGGGFLISKSVQPKAEIVLAESEEAEEATDPETPEEPTETETPEEPAEGGSEEKPAESETSGGASAPAQAASNSTEGLPKSVIKALLKTLRDALKDLIAHIKQWFGLK